MQTIETVSIEDCYPYEDEYGNRILERDYSTKENKRYVKALADSMRAKGVPDEPPVLARDGGIYRIVSGNSRIRAMRELGTTRFPAVVLDDLDAEAALRRAVEAAVRTNTKKLYESAELSSYVQQLCMFADDKYVAEAAGIEPERVAKVRRARRVVGDDGDGYTIERMCAIAEFEGDQEAVDALSKCKERDLDWTVYRLRKEAEDREYMRAMREAMDELGIVVMDKEPEGAIYVTYVRNKPMVRGAYEEASPLVPTVAVQLPSGGYRLYRMPNADDVEADLRKAAEREERDLQKIADRAMAGRLADRRGTWLERQLANWTPTRLPHVQEEAADRYAPERGVEWCRAHGVAVCASPAEVAAYVTRLDDHEFGPWWYGWGGNGARQLNDNRAGNWLDVYDVMVADGYEPCEEERELIGLLEKREDEEGEGE